MFKRRGQLTVLRSAVQEDQLLEIVLDAGAEDLTTDEDLFVVTTPHDRLYQVGEAIRKQGINVETQKLIFIPDNTVAVTDETTATQVLRLYDALDDNDDVQNVYGNFDILDELLTKLSNHSG